MWTLTCISYSFTVVDGRRDFVEECEDGCDDHGEHGEDVDGILEPSVSVWQGLVNGLFIKVSLPFTSGSSS